MENGKNGLILAQKREYHGKFSTEFFLSLICVRYMPKDLYSGEKTGRYGPWSQNILELLEEFTSYWRKNATLPTNEA